MKILILNTNNPFIDSGIVALDLFNQLKGRGHEVKLLVNRFYPDYPEGIISLKSLTSVRYETLQAKLEGRLKAIFGKIIKVQKEFPRNPDYCFFQIDERKLIYKTNRLLKKADIKPDVIIILYAAKFINAKNIYELQKKTNAKVFWLLYDMAAFTGGCHYAWDCQGYQNNCGSCPGLFSSDPCDISYRNLVYKKSFIDKTNLQVLAGSEWQYLQAKQSAIFKKKLIHKMLIPFDANIFKPVVKDELRLAMKIPVGKKVIFFGAVGLTERRKGMDYLIESLAKLKGLINKNDSDLVNNILLLAAGQEFDKIVELLPFECQNLGYVNSSSDIASAYQVADVFVCPSIEDSGPTMINQSLMCGTPVVSFEMGVSLDLVINGQTGYRAKLKDSSDMAQGIFDILKMKSHDYKRLSVSCRDLALSLCSFEVRTEILENLMKSV